MASDHTADTPNRGPRLFYSAKEAAAIIGIDYKVFCEWCRAPNKKRRPPVRRFIINKTARIRIPIKKFHEWLEQGNP